MIVTKKDLGEIIHLPVINQYFTDNNDFYINKSAIITHVDSNNIQFILLDEPKSGHKNSQLYQCSAYQFDKIDGIITYRRTHIHVNYYYRLASEKFCKFVDDKIKPFVNNNSITYCHIVQHINEIITIINIDELFYEA